MPFLPRLTLIASSPNRKQSFSIPGSLFLNLIAGRLYPTYVAFPLVCTVRYSYLQSYFNSFVSQILTCSPSS